ncbi:sulfite exporter TauE/SafE family protein [Kribbella qitaiheensis]|uniref:Probable membrane transporter protein n=1 Tax=Kribbella qitaiheensis TaxID=1544730 RepID=A0A7G6XAE8_9ACTN|nr:sulfite exporter TauE/SafE family protein [Kribbella qitaiheensis]
MTGMQQLAVVAAGLGAGMLTSTVGVASLVSFPVLIALGIPPVVANVSNTLGLIPGSLSGTFGYRRELIVKPRVVWFVVLTCSVGAVVGAVLLLSLPPGVFEAAVPWLIVLACLTVGVQPLIARWLRRHGEPGGSRGRLSPATTVFAGLTGVYGGYFGAGAGVMMMAVLSLGLDLDLRVVNALKTLALMVANIVAGLIFVFVADVNFTVAGLLAIGSVVGGYVGAHIGRRLPPTILRVLIIAAGLTTAITMF